MNDHQAYPAYEERGEIRERREPFNQQYSQPPHPQQHLQSQTSPSQSASPFAFAPPPLSHSTSAGSRPVPSLHHSDQTAQQPSQPYNYYPHPAKSFPSYASSAPMGYRSYSNEWQRPLAPSLARTPSLSTNNAPAQGSPLASPYQRQVSNGYPSPHALSSPQRPNVYPQQYYSSGSYPSSAEMPRSMSYPSTYAQPYTYLPSMSTPSIPMHQSGTLPPLVRHNTTGTMDGGIPGLDRPSLGYSFANRLPLVDRPFKCDECVQSFNRNHDLKRHKRIHLSVKPFGCDKCGKMFSRKDALRRHWLVKGCRGEEGATAPIIPMFPLNSNPPGLSPPSPPGNVSPSEHGHSGMGYHPPASFSHPAAPPPLNTLPMRQASDQSQIIVTPSEVASQSMRAEIATPMDEPMVVDSTMGEPHSSSARGSGSSMGESTGYFEGVVGLKQDGTALIDSTAGVRSSSGRAPGPSSPYSRYATSPHPYRRPGGGANGGSGSGSLDSPNRTQVSPSYPARSSPSSTEHDAKPVFALPFTPTGQNYQSQDGMLAPPHESVRMEKQHSTESAPETWQRWHRPSFPFPPPPGANYHSFDPSSAAIDVPATAAQGYP